MDEYERNRLKEAAATLCDFCFKSQECVDCDCNRCSVDLIQKALDKEDEEDD